MASGFLVALTVVFLAEVGDKTQLVVLTMGGRHRPLAVIGALAVAIALLQTISVAIGAAVGEAVPDRAVAVGTGLLFCGFAVWTWRSAGADEHGHGTAAPASLAAIAGAFFLAELGDKTMFTTASLAADRGVVAVWLGSFVAMVGASALAVLAGRAINRRVRPATIARVGAAAFAVVGVGTLLTAL